jgi:hypothetical protein
MPREWLEQRGKARYAGCQNPLADPLESEAWRGLDWILPLLTRMARPNAHRDGRAASPDNRPLGVLRPVRRS